MGPKGNWTVEKLKLMILSSKNIFGLLTTMLILLIMIQTQHYITISPATVPNSKSKNKA